MAKLILHTSESRGISNHGWLHSKHTFSFGDYYNADRLHFGALRVLNESIIAPGMGYGMHPQSGAF